MYDSPIRLAVSKMTSQFNDDIYNAEVKTWIDVDKGELARALNYDRNQYEKGYRDGLKASKWNSVKDPPASGEVCLLACKATNCYSGKTYRYVCDGFYIERWKEEVRYDVSEDQAIEYNEETDEYYLCEGWYERIHNWDDYISVYISDTVTHWQPLPKPPKEEGEPI